MLDCRLNPFVDIRSLLCGLGKGHFTHETESPCPMYFKHLVGGKGRGGPTLLHTPLEGPIEYVGECKMDVNSTWIPTLHQMDHVSWSLGPFLKTTSWR